MAERRKKYAQLMGQDSRKDPVSKALAVQDVSLVAGTLSVLQVRKSETPMTSNREVQTVTLRNLYARMMDQSTAKDPGSIALAVPELLLASGVITCTAKVTASGGEGESPDFWISKNSTTGNSEISRPNSRSLSLPSQFGS